MINTHAQDYSHIQSTFMVIYWCSFIINKESGFIVCKKVLTYMLILKESGFIVCKKSFNICADDHKLFYRDCSF